MRGAVTVVLVHGAGHTAAVWRETQAALVPPSVAVDLPGRGSRPADITRVTLEACADAVLDQLAGVAGDLVLVGHSVGGIVLPPVAGRLTDRVRHLVFIAGITTQDGQLPRDLFLPGRGARVDRQLADFRRRYAGRTLEDIGVKAAGAVDSLNLSSQRMSWAGVPAALPRTFVRCLRDPIQPRDLQARLAASCGAGDVLDVDSGHTPAVDAPEALAALLVGVVDRVLEPTAG